MDAHEVVSTDRLKAHMCDAPVEPTFTHEEGGLLRPQPKMSSLPLQPREDWGMGEHICEDPCYMH
jgi:hypothetical protein